jgi:uncharacterized membrane protein
MLTLDKRAGTKMTQNLLRDKRAISATFWALFFGFCLVPLLALGTEMGRYFFARSQIAAAADSAALAAAVEISTNTFTSTGQIAFTSNTYTWAQRAANANGEELLDKDITPRVSNIKVQGNTVMVAVTADLSILFPSIVPDVLVTEWGTAEVRALKH